jgi:hypothetical protein
VKAALLLLQGRSALLAHVLFICPITVENQMIKKLRTAAGLMAAFSFAHAMALTIPL